MSVRSPRWAQVAGLGALVVLNVVLIALLLARPSLPAGGEPDAPPPDPGAATAVKPATERATGEPAPETAESTDEPDDDALAPAERILVNADATTAWRATVGSCTSPGVLERSTDAGGTWDVQPIDLAPVSRVRVLGTETLFAIGGGADCEPAYFSSSVGGTAWLSNDQYLEGSWYLLPADRDFMAAPVGQVQTPCQAVELAALDTVNAAVLCTNGTIELTQDGGGSWSQQGTELDAWAIGTAEGGYVLAGVADACGEDLAVHSMEVFGAADEPTCTGTPADDPAEVAVSAAGGAMWLWGGDDVVVTPDWAE